MISLKKYISSGRDELTSAALDSSALLIDGMARHAVNCDPVDFDTLQLKFRKLNREFEETPSPDGIRMAATSAVGAMQAYNQGIEKNTKSHLREMLSIVGMLTETVSQGTAGSEKSVSNLQSITTQLQEVYEIEDVRVVKGRLAEALKRLREETSRQKELAAREMAELAELRVAMSPECGQMLDRRKAEMALVKVYDRAAGMYAVVFCVDRIDAIRGRFGAEAAQQAMQACRDHAAQNLAPGDRILCWQDPAFLAIVQRSGPPDTVRAEFKRLDSSLPSQIPAPHDRSVPLPLAQKFAVLSLAECPAADALILNIEAFIAESLPKRTDPLQG
ncbi:MAG: hypothetical protein ACR2I2_23105 [Bryobacteraceae bacterium]